MESCAIERTATGHALLRGALLLGAMLLSGCDDESPAEPETPAVTWADGVQAIVAQRCTRCHDGGGAAPFALRTHADLMAAADAVAFSVRSGSMPPVRTRADCRTFANDHRMPDTERETLLAWLDAGLPAGDLDGFVPVEPSTDALAAPSMALQPAAPYAPSVDAPDDFRCLPLGAPFDETTWITAHAFEPDATELVHHVILYVVPPDGVDGMRAEDDAAPGPGYDCYGSSGHGGQQMGVWAPGGGPQRFPPESAFEMPAGAQIVAQMHYNTAYGAVRPDQSTLLLETVDVAPPLRVTMPIFGGFFRVPAGEEATFDFAYRFADEMPEHRIFAVLPHMHTVGRQIDVEFGGAEDDTCVVDVEDWDFDWQQFYALPGPGLPVTGGDELRYRCTFDNIDGDAPVEFGEGSDDEMCLVVLAMVGPPPEPAPDGQCPDYGTCRDACADPGSVDCYLECVPGQPAECGGCLLQGVGECARAQCAAPFGEMIQCVSQQCTVDLMDAAGMLACLGDACRPAFEQTWDCLRPVIADGVCDDGFDGCGTRP